MGNAIDFSDSSSSKQNINDRSQESKSSADLSANVWDDLKQAKNVNDGSKPLTLSDTAPKTGSDAFSLSTAAKPTSDALPSLQLFDSGNQITEAEYQKTSSKDQVSPSDKNPTQTKVSDEKWQTYSASYVGETAAAAAANGGK